MNLDQDEADNLERRFTYHAPKEDQAHRYFILRGRAKQLALDIIKNCPASPERAQAIHYIDIAVMMANAAIARNE